MDEYDDRFEDKRPPNWVIALIVVFCLFSGALVLSDIMGGINISAIFKPFTDSLSDAGDTFNKATEHITNDLKQYGVDINSFSEKDIERLDEMSDVIILKEVINETKIKAEISENKVNEINLAGGYSTETLKKYLDKPLFIKYHKDSNTADLYDLSFNLLSGSNWK